MTGIWGDNRDIYLIPYFIFFWGIGQCMWIKLLATWWRWSWGDLVWTWLKGECGVGSKQWREKDDWRQWEGGMSALQMRRDGRWRSLVAVQDHLWGWTLSVTVEGSCLWEELLPVAVEEKRVIIEGCDHVEVINRSKNWSLDMCWRAGNSHLWGLLSFWDGHQKGKSGFGGVLKSFQR